MELKGTFLDFLASDGLKLDGILLESTSDVAVLHVHGLTSSFSSSVGNQVWEACKELDLGCFLINTRGKGFANGFKRKKKAQSEDEYERFLGGTSYELFEECLFDIEGAIEALKGRGFSKIVLSGHSTGCQKALYCALKKKFSELIGLVFLAPGDDYAIFRRDLSAHFDEIVSLAQKEKDSKALFVREEFSYFSAKRFYDLLKEDSVEGDLFNYEKGLKHISKIDLPILAVFGRDEEYAVISCKRMLELIADQCSNKRSKTVLIDGDHNFHGAKEELVSVLKEWLKKDYPYL